MRALEIKYELLQLRLCLAVLGSAQQPNAPQAGVNGPEVTLCQILRGVQALRFWPVPFAVLVE